jgi:hypothetical protein
MAGIVSFANRAQKGHSKSEKTIIAIGAEALPCDDALAIDKASFGIAPSFGSGLVVLDVVCPSDRLKLCQNTAAHAQIISAVATASVLARLRRYVRYRLVPVS